MASHAVTLDATDASFSRIARRHVALAQRAIQHVRARLPVARRAHPDREAHHVSQGAMSAWLTGRFEQVWMVGSEADAVATRSDDFAAPGWLSRFARLAQREGDHGAGAQAAVAFAYLYELGIRPLDYMHLTGRGLAFVLIGRSHPPSERAPSEQDGERAETLVSARAAAADFAPETWGEDAVVCDPYRGLVFRQPDLIHTEHYYDYYPAESQLYVPRARSEQHE